MISNFRGSESGLHANAGNIGQAPGKRHHCGKANGGDRSDQRFRRLQGIACLADGCIKTELKWNMNANSRFTILNYHYLSLTKRLGNF
jgi:hypothetical protein